jgi:hypothetical protein
MALKGTAAIAIWSAIEPAMLEEHDAWHSVEHFAERLSVPGFLRGRRGAAVDPAAAEQRFIFYEIESIAVATSAPYLERLNHPTPWSRKIMAASRLNRTLCRVVASQGFGIGAHLLALRMRQGEGLAAELATIARTPGIVGAHLLQKDSNVVRPSTAEEKLRHGGVDASTDWILLVEAYDAGALDAIPREALAAEPAMRYTLAQVATR